MASAVTSNENVIITRDYTDNFSIKDSAINKLGPKYFEGVDLSGLNVGELGFVLEQIANITEDAFNTSSVMMNEAFPNKAVMPESIYSHAAIFQLNNAFTQCGQCSFIFLLQQDDILKYGTTVGSKTNFYIDKRTVINVEDIPFTLDYDIEIIAQKNFNNGISSYDYAAQYIIDDNNSISSVNDPYLKLRETSNGYLILQLTAHQVVRTEITDTIISNSKINYPVLTFSFEDNLAGFDIFYKSPTDTSYTQLTKLIKFSLPVKTPFCYYKLKDDQTIEITFSSRDGYFQPDFNSEIKIVTYTTLGKDGNFEMYTGTKIEFQLSSERYPYNSKMVISAKPISECAGGAERLSLEALQALTVESYSTANELSDDNDIMTYFYNYKYRYGNEILVIKRRDDITERLFSAFLLLKNDTYIYPTNTMNIDLSESSFDSSDEEKNRFTLKPGHVFVYDDTKTSDNTLRLIPGVMSYESEKVAELMTEYDFVYTNPFLISLNKRPNAVGLYKSIVSQTCSLDYVSANPDIFSQFITSKINITRELEEKSEYTMSLSLIPSASLDDDEIKNRYINTLGSYENNYVRVIVALIGSDNMERGYIELYPSYQNPNDPSNITFSVKLETDDRIRTNGEFAILNAVKAKDFIKSDNVYIPISDAKVNVYILYKTGNLTTNRFEQYDEFKSTGIEEFEVSNIYSNRNDGLTYIEPMNMMRSTVTFNTVGDDINAHLTLLPVIKADVVSNATNFDTFINKLTQNYRYIEECLPRLRNNTHIDIKFYNTYGRSKNYYIGDEQELINRVNITIKFKVSIVDGTDDIEIRKNLKTFIKEFIERVNSSGNNDLFISNLIREIETNFASVHHLKFMGINDYDTNYQTISIRTTNLNELTKEERRQYVPEILVADLDNIILSIDVEKNS